MLQIIGWLGCAMLAVKVLEITANPTSYLEDGNIKASTLLAVIIGWTSVFGFALWLYMQGSAMPDAPVGPSDMPAPLTDAQIECISRSKTTEETLACAP